MESNNTNKTVSIVAVVAVVAAIVGGTLWFVNRDNSNNDAQEQATNQTEQQQAKDIVATAIATENLSTLVTAVKAAGLVETLQGEGPYTVFAPTNQAFANLPAGTLDTLLKAENVEQLKDILTYHVVTGKVLSKDLQNGQVVKTVNGQNLTVEITDGKVYLVDAKGGKALVSTADVETSNGVVHIIDGVLLPQ